MMFASRLGQGAVSPERRTNHPLRLVLIVGMFGAVAFALLSPGLPHARATVTCDTSWTGGDGDWSNAGDWSSGVPGASSNACLPAGSYTVTVFAESVQAGTLSVGAGASLTLQISGCGPIDARLTLSGNMSNAGTVNLDNFQD